MMVTVAPLPVMVMGFPLGSDAERPVRATGVDVSVVPAAIWNVTEATAPSPIALVLMPATTHRTSPADTVLQAADLLAALAADPVE